MLGRAGKAFYDSNVLLYGFRGDAGRVRTVGELLNLRGTISVQVLNEMTNVCRRKLAMSLQEIEIVLQPLRTLVNIVPVTLAVHDRAFDLLRRYNLSVYDAVLVAAALEAGCSTLYSEDMQAGLVVDGRLDIVNPFAA